MPVNFRLRSWVDESLARWLPARCLLCGAPGAGTLSLCRACWAELPRNAICCSRCALPLESPLPLCGRCIQRAPPWHAAWAPFRYAWPLAPLEARFKFGGELAAGRSLALAWLDSERRIDLPQALLPVPLHRVRLRQRGYNQALELARPMARRFGLPILREALQRVRATGAQTELSALQRRRNVRGAFRMRPGATLPAHVALLDDVCTTGATLAECTRVLQRAGVARVDVWALARAPQRG